MRIHSKFKDYYDIGLQYGIDEHCHYKRETTEVTPGYYGLDGKRGVVKDETIAAGEALRDVFTNHPRCITRRQTYGFSASWEHVISEQMFSVIMFCGKVYPFWELKIDSKDGLTLYDTYFCYSTDDFTKVVKKYGSKDEIKAYMAKKPKKVSKWVTNAGMTKVELDKYFDNFNHTLPAAEDWQCDTKIPIAVIETGGYNQNGKIIYNPVLKDYEFYKAVDSYTAFQELSMFISGVLGGSSPAMIEISDDMKVHKHGFDKWSFRKEPEEKK